MSDSSNQAQDSTETRVTIQPILSRPRSPFFNAIAKVYYLILPHLTKEDNIDIKIIWETGTDVSLDLKITFHSKLDCYNIKTEITNALVRHKPKEFAILSLPEGTTEFHLIFEITREIGALWAKEIEVFQVYCQIFASDFVALLRTLSIESSPNIRYSDYSSFEMKIPWNQTIEAVLKPEITCFKQNRLKGTSLAIMANCCGLPENTVSWIHFKDGEIQDEFYAIQKTCKARLNGRNKSEPIDFGLPLFLPTWICHIPELKDLTLKTNIVFIIRTSAALSNTDIEFFLQKDLIRQLRDLQTSNDGLNIHLKQEEIPIDRISISEITNMEKEENPRVTESGRNSELNQGRKTTSEVQNITLAKNSKTFKPIPTSQVIVVETENQQPPKLGRKSKSNQGRGSTSKGQHKPSNSEKEPINMISANQTTNTEPETSQVLNPANTSEPNPIHTNSSQTIKTGKKPKGTIPMDPTEYMLKESIVESIATIIRDSDNLDFVEACFASLGIATSKYSSSKENKLAIFDEILKRDVMAASEVLLKKGRKLAMDTAGPFEPIQLPRDRKENEENDGGSMDTGVILREPPEMGESIWIPAEVSYDQFSKINF